MLADPSAQLKLLEVQELDSRHDSLRHQAKHPPEAQELAAQKARREEIDGHARDAQMEVDDLTREQRKADDDVEHVKGRRVRDQQRLDSGQVTNPKDLERLQHELVSLDRRISDLEDVEIDVMERLEHAHLTLTSARDEVERIDARLAELEASRVARLAELREEAAVIKTDREKAIAAVPADLLALYEKLREANGGVGASALRAKRCGGCSLQLDNQLLADIAKLPDDDVIRCEECGRILIRTPESGLPTGAR